MTKRTRKEVKAWALIQSDGYLSPRWSSEHSVFQPRIYTTKEGAEKVADVVVTGGSRLRAVPCTIIYDLT